MYFNRAETKGTAMYCGIRILFCDSVATDASCCKCAWIVQYIFFYGHVRKKLMGHGTKFCDFNRPKE